jgi:hypothetical protein
VSQSGLGGELEEESSTWSRVGSFGLVGRWRSHDASRVWFGVD